MKLLFAFVFSSSAPAWGAACCGGAVAASALISSDNRAQLSSSLSRTEVIVENVDSRGIWQKADSPLKTQTLTLEGAHLISDRWQLGASLPVIQRSKSTQSYSGIGDTSLTLGYEYLPDWDYNPIRPKGIGFFKLIVPTGKSKYESESGGLDSRGNGLWSLGVGTLLTKAFGPWDFFSSLEFRRSLDKKISTSQIDGTLKPGSGGALGIGAGFNTTHWRFGSSINWNYEDPTSVQGSSNIKGAVERFATGAISVSYLADETWSSTFSYSDQTLFGDPINTSLGRSLSLQLQRSWNR